MKSFPFLFFFFSFLSLPAQEIKQNAHYHDNIIPGIYQIESLNSKYITDNIIEPQKTFKTFSEDIHYIDVSEKELILFNKSKPKSNKDVAGRLASNSLAIVLEKNYQAIYQEINSNWNVTFEVWNKIQINGIVYYTDYKLHDFQAFQIELPKLGQTFIMFAQSAGYDYHYDLAYPEHFHILVFGEENDILFESKELDIYNGHEFWETGKHMGSFTYQILKNGNITFSITGTDQRAKAQNIYNPKTYSMTWNGHKLIKNNLTVTK